MSLVVTRTLMAIFVVMLAQLSTACSSDNLDDERFKSEDRDLNISTAECRRSTKTGCIQGQVVAAPSLSIGGQSYFDAETFFKDIETTVFAKANVKAEEMQLNWVGATSNSEFADNFSVYVKGSAAYQGITTRGGLFNINDLPEGSYDVRVQKVFHLELMKRKANTAELSEPIAIDEKPLVEKYALTLHATATVDVVKNTRTMGLVVDQFKYELRSLK